MYDNTTKQDSSGYVNSLTFSHTTAGSNRGLVVGISCRTGVADISGATYNGVSLTSEVNSENTNVCGVTTWSLIAPASGANDVVVSLGGYKLLTAVAVSFQDADQTDLVEATAAADNHGSEASDTVTTVTDGAMVLMFANLENARTVTVGRFYDGETGDGGSNSTSSTDAQLATKITASFDGELQTLTARIHVSGSGSTVAKAVVYSDDTGNPDTLLATSDELSITNNTEAENEFTFSGSEMIDLVSGTDYWIGVAYEDPGSENFTWSRGSTSGVSRKKNTTYSTGPIDPWGSTSNLSGPLDFYIEVNTGETSRNNSDHSDGSLGQTIVSTQPVATAGATDSASTWTGGGDDWAIALLSVKPASGTAYTKTLTEAVALVDTISSQTNKTLSEAVTLVDTVTNQINISLQEAVALVDGVTNAIGKAFSEVVTLVDIKINQTAKILAEAVSLVDVLASVFSAIRTFTETITATDSVSKLTGKAMSESVALVDTINKSVSKILIEAITVVDNVLLTISRVFTEAVILVDDIAIVSSKIFQEAVTLADDMLSSASKLFSESLALVDNITTSAQFSRALVEAIALVDSVARTLVINRTFTEAISFIDTITSAATTKARKGITILTTTADRAILHIKNIAKSILGSSRGDINVLQSSREDITRLDTKNDDKTIL